MPGVGIGAGKRDWGVQPLSRTARASSVIRAMTWNKCDRTMLLTFTFMLPLYHSPERERVSLYQAEEYVVLMNQARFPWQPGNPGQGFSKVEQGS